MHTQKLNLNKLGQDAQRKKINQQIKKKLMAEKHASLVEI